jgi:hypothetical protein
MLLATEPSQLDIHRLQQTADPIDHTVAVALHLHPHARQVPQLANRSGRHEAAAQQPVLQKLGDPPRIDAVGLTAPQRAHHLRIHQQQVEPQRTGSRMFHTGIQ